MEEKDELENLFDGLADLTEDETREVIKQSGRNPDVVLAEAMKRLKNIQTKGDQPIRPAS